MIPMAIDSKQLIEDLSKWGWLDFKIETVCGFSRGYVAQIRCGNIKEMSYARAARLYNFWLEEEHKNKPLAPAPTMAGQFREMKFSSISPST
jgi:hypothetical protein